MSQKYAIVTGASSGIGSSISLELSRGGYFVALVGRNQGKLTQLHGEIKEEGGESLVLIANLSDQDGVNKLIADIKLNTKQVDVLVNAAAIWHDENEVFAGRDFETFPQHIVNDTLMVGLMAPTLLCHALIPLMPKRGKIINISGTFENGGKGWLPYFVSKRGIEDLTLGLADELRDKDIQANCISPSDTATDVYKKYFPQYIEEAIEPEEIAKRVIKLCYPESDKITGKVFVMKKDQLITEKFHA
jgi:NAD(P)-dependent dehydrogenase (short-subunit alcohol dehydrogenase family)